MNETSCRHIRHFLRDNHWHQLVATKKLHFTQRMNNTMTLTFWTLLLAFLAATSAFVLKPQAPLPTSSLWLSTTNSIEQQQQAAAPAVSDALASTLRKASKTLAVILEVTDQDRFEVSTKSMQLRKLRTSALATSNVDIAKELVLEQATAQGE